MNITRRLLISEEKQIFIEVITYSKSSSEIFELPTPGMRLLEEDDTIPKPPLLLLQCKGYSFALI